MKKNSIREAEFFLVELILKIALKYTFSFQGVALETKSRCADNVRKIKLPTIIKMVADIFQEHPTTVLLSCIPSFKKFHDNIKAKHLAWLLLKLWKYLVDSENGYAFNM